MSKLVKSLGGVVLVCGCVFSVFGKKFHGVVVVWEEKHTKNKANA